MIDVKNLCKDYGPHHAISNLNFSISKGDVVGFLGPNGAGKSTTMKIITGFMAPTSGNASVAGFDVFENPIEVKKRIGYLPEVPPVYPDQFVRDYLEYVAKLKRVEKSQIKQLVDRSMEKTHLGPVQHRLIGHLSKGFKQRVGIAQALVSNPDILILDEPTVGLDPKQVAEIRDLIKELRGDHTIILSTHILPEVQATCERVIIINKGQIVAQDLIENLSKFEKGQTRVHVRLQKNINGESDLKNINGVQKVTRGSRDGEWIIELNGDESNVSRLAEIVVQKGWGLLELAPHRMDLEDVFLKLTYGDKGADL